MLIKNAHLHVREWLLGDSKTAHNKFALYIHLGVSPAISGVWFKTTNRLVKYNWLKNTISPLVRYHR